MATHAPLLAALDCERAAFLEGFDGLTDAQRAHPPAPDAWSIDALAEHLYKVERGLLLITEKQLSAGDARRDLGPVSRAKVLATLAALRAPIRLRVPEGAPIHPTGERYTDFRAAWVAAAARWPGVAAALPPALESAGLVRHPTAGPLTFEQTLRFLTVHARHHRPQLERTLTAARRAVEGVQ